MPRKVFVAGEILTAADVNTNLMDQAVMVFDDSAARGSAIPSPSEGMVTYLKDTDALEKFDGSNFVNVNTDSGKILQVVNGARTTAFSTSSTSYVTITDATVTITPSSTSSKFFVMATATNADSQTERFYAIHRNGTLIGHESIGKDFNAKARMAANSVLDSPSTDSAVTYDLRIRVSSSSISNVFAQITVMEVAG